MNFFSARACNFNLNCSVIAVFTIIKLVIQAFFKGGGVSPILPPGMEIKMDVTLVSQLMVSPLHMDRKPTFGSQSL